MLAERLADIDPLRREERVRHAAANDQGIDFFDEVEQEVELGRDFCAADNGNNRLDRLAKALLQRLKFGLHGTAGIGWHEMGEALSRGMGAVGSGEGIVDENIAIGRQILGKIRIVLFFLFVEPRVLETDNIAVLHLAHCGSGRSANAIRSETNRLPDNGRNGSRYRLQRHARVRAIFWAAKMREKYDFRALAGKLQNRRRHPLNARRVAHFAVLHRHIEIDAQQYALARDIADLVQSPKAAHDYPSRK